MLCDYSVVACSGNPSGLAEIRAPLCHPLPLGLKDYTARSWFEGLHSKWMRLAGDRSINLIVQGKRDAGQTLLC